VFADVDNSDRLAREEVFGPFMAMIPFSDDDDAIAIANDNNYGLGGSVWTTDEQRGIDVSRPRSRYRQTSNRPAGTLGRFQPARWNIGPVPTGPLEHWAG
jgi:acyl-CoA reductase-like NAD-dependent aldehyde dehydrogenase